jgi:nucleotide-binding universal stress UspA family protein
MAEGEPFAARRILVGIDASSASLDALEAAALVAARIGSELAGLFVEDEDLLRLAALPFGDIVRSPGGERERLDRASVETALRAVASHAREALERTASSHRVTCSFRVRRGRVAREVLAAAEGADLVVLGAGGHGHPARGALGETARAAAGLARSPVLLLARGSSLGGGTVAVDDATPAGTRAVAAARRLAPEDRPPAIVCTADAGDVAVLDAIARLDPALVVLPAAAPATAPGLLARLLAEGTAVLLVR